MEKKGKYLKEKIDRTVSKHEMLRQGDHVIMGISGGPDSLTMFLYFLMVARERGLYLHAVHVNHMLRGEDADNDQKFVEKLCQNTRVSLRSVRFDCAKYAKDRNMTLEEAGRKVRYESFDEEARRIVSEGADEGAVKIATAHNLDDQAETILLRILRGTGTDGLAGIQYMTKDEAGFWRIRPMLDISRAEIREYCEEQGLVPREDKTNEDTMYSRNRIRKELMPVLETYNPKIREALARLAGSAEEDRAYFRDAAEDAAARAVTEIGEGYLILSGKVLRELPGAVRKRLYVQALSELGFKEDFTYAHLSKADELLRGDSPSAKILLPHGFYITRRYEDLKFVSAEAGQQDHAPSGLDVSIGTPEDAAELLKRKNGKAAAFDLKKFREKYGDSAEERLELRTREPGDTISVRIGGEDSASGKQFGRKKIQDLYVDRKVPKDARDEIRYVACGSDVLFIPESPWAGLRAQYAADLSFGENTKEVLLVETFWAL